MKKNLTRTIILFVAINLTTAGFALAQNDIEKESQPASKETLIAEKEAELARRRYATAAKVAQKEAEFAQKQVELQIPKNIVVAPRIPLLGDMPLLGHGGGGAVLVIPAAELKVEDLAAITEDMTVMSRIFENKLSQAHLTTGRESLFIRFDSLSFGRGSGAIEAIYLEDYGALFFMKVNALLSPPPEASEEEETEEEDTDPLWTEMRRRMYEPKEFSRRRRTGRPEEKYDAEKVEDLKETLIKTLKHAANIRALKPNESVILTVIGKAGQPTVSAIERLNEEDYSRNIVSTRTGTGSLSPTVLTIRAKKADIDAFAKGQFVFDQFRQKTQLLSYSYLGENISAEPSRSSFDLGRNGRRSGSRGSSSPR